jgi:hypothetical protein
MGLPDCASPLAPSAPNSEQFPAPGLTTTGALQARP